METLFERMAHAQQAHARSTDPETSHMAAEAVTPGLTELQFIVELIALRFPDGFTDVDLTAARPDLGPSTLRTRRAELFARNVILDSMRRVRPNGHTQPHTVWIHRSFVDDPRPVVEASAPPTKADKSEAMRLADELDKGAKQMRSEGRSMFSYQLVEAASMLRKFGQ